MLRHVRIAALMLVFPHSVMAQSLFHDGFDDGSACQWEPLRGNWAVTEDGWYQGHGGHDSYSFAGDESWTDYTFSLRAQGIGVPTDPNLRMLIVYFRASAVVPVCVGCGRPDMMAYRLEVWHADSRRTPNRIDLKRIMPGQPFVSQVNKSVSVPSHAIDLVISVNQDVIDVRLDGQQVIHVVDEAPIRSGKIGVSAIWAGGARFDDVKVDCEAPSRVVWQIGIPSNSDDEFGTTPMQRSPITYRVRDDWDRHVDQDDGTWLSFPGQLNPPEDWPTMPQTVHVQFSTTADWVLSELRAWVSFRAVDQGERLRVEVDGSFIDDVSITNGDPEQVYVFSLGELSVGDHVMSLTNTGGGGTVFDYLQLAAAESPALCSEPPPGFTCSCPSHPADLDGDRDIEPWELSGYVTCFLLACSEWPGSDGQPSSAAFASRAGTLFLRGEFGQADYCCDATLPAPLSWRVPGQCGVVAAVASQEAIAVPGPSVATREIREGDSFVNVLIRIQPSVHSTAYAIEEKLPPGLAVRDVSHGGVYHTHLSSIRWGPFLDNEPRDVTYEVVVPNEDALTGSFDGVVSFDGRDTRVQGQNEITTLHGDTDRDGDVDLADYLQLVECLSATAMPISSVCDVFDFDGDGQVGLADIVAFQAAFTGTR